MFFQSICICRVRWKGSARCVCSHRAVTSCAYSHSFQTFHEIYDATHLLRPVDRLKRVGISTLSAGDVVLVECLCVKDEVIDGFKVIFDLLSIHVIAKVF